MIKTKPFFKSFWQAGFECSTHILRNGRRLDLVASTSHDIFADKDYKRLRGMGIQTVREGLRWHLIEHSPGHFDFSSAIPLIRAALANDIQIIWDLLHFGWPRWLDIFSPDWVDRFGQFAFEFGQLLREETRGTSFVAPVNEISFVSWAGGDVGYLNPFAHCRGRELKWQLVRGVIAASRAIRAQIPDVRLVAPDPAIHVVGDPACSEDMFHAAATTFSMFQAWDMICGRAQPELGGDASFLDIIGINYYDRNQRLNTGQIIDRDHPKYRPLRDILIDVARRYNRPIFISETGAEGDARPAWFAYVAAEVRAAAKAGADLHGVCLYPILNHPGWDDDRHCHNGLWDYPNPAGERELYLPLARELARQEPPKEESMEPNFQLSLFAGKRIEPDLICLSHLRWNFVFQRPQHLMSRFARGRRVFFIEEPLFDAPVSRLEASVCPVTGVCVVVPHLTGSEERNQILETLLNDFFESYVVKNPVLWFYTPMALEFIPSATDPVALVYDCMDELSMFLGAPARLQALERDLIRKADLLFTGGVSLFEAKRPLHPRAFPFPSGVELSHFAQARSLPADFAEHKTMPRPRLGYAGVIDERLDMDLLAGAARLRPDWQFVMVGPLAKISRESLPRNPNIHWLGIKSYAELPQYFAGWDVGIMPFALNDATRFISPTKTPEYLAAGLPVVSTAIRDVVRPYGEAGLAAIASSPEEFVIAAEQLINAPEDDYLRKQTDVFLEAKSWDSVWERMDALISDVIGERKRARALHPVPAPSFEALASQTGVPLV